MAGARRKAWYKEHIIPMMCSHAADMSAAFLPSSPFYSKKLEKPATEIARRKGVLGHASPHNRAQIARGVELAEHAYRELLIRWSIKHAFRAIDFPLSGRNEVKKILMRHAALLPFISPDGRRDIGIKESLRQKNPKSKRYAMSKLGDAIAEMNRELDECLGFRRRKQFFHYFSQFYGGGIHYRKTIVAHHSNPDERE